MKHDQNPLEFQSLSQASVSEQKETQQAQSPQQSKQKPTHRLQTITCKELMEKSFPPTRFVVEGLLPQGLAILSAPSKYGKSWFALQMLLAVSAGKPFLDLQTTPVDAYGAGGYSKTLAGTDTKIVGELSRPGCT